MPDENILNNQWIKHAFLVSELSKDPSTKVGSLIVSPDNRQFSIGYNGFPRGIEETDEKWQKRELKYEYVIHAEENCILNCPFETKNCKIYITHKPCHKCLGKIIQVGIKDIFYSIDYNRLGNENIWNDLAKYVNIRKI